MAQAQATPRPPQVHSLIGARQLLPPRRLPSNTGPRRPVASGRHDAVTPLASLQRWLDLCG